jgi:hypothetical protein
LARRKCQLAPTPKIQGRDEAERAAVGRPTQDRLASRIWNVEDDATGNRDPAELGLSPPAVGCHFGDGPTAVTLVAARDVGPRHPQGAEPGSQAPSALGGGAAIAGIAIIMLAAMAWRIMSGRK